jgi:hypothetical protein
VSEERHERHCVFLVVFFCLIYIFFIFIHFNIFIFHFKFGFFVLILCLFHFISNLIFKMKYSHVREETWRNNADNLYMIRGHICFPPKYQTWLTIVLNSRNMKLKWL